MDPPVGRRRFPRSVRLPWPVVALLILSSLVAWPLALAMRRSLAGRAASAPRRGPWGALERQEMMIEPRLGLITPDVCDIPPTTWYFPGVARGAVEGTVDGAGVADGDRDRLLRALTCGHLGCRLAPPEDLLLRLSPDARAKLYTLVGRFQQNGFVFSPYRRTRARFDNWFDGDGLAPETVSLLRSLSYPAGDGIAFADLALLCSRIPDAEEKTRLLRALFRSPGLEVLLNVPPHADVETLARYWGTGPQPRHKDLRVLLGSLARAGGGRIDIVHLLPQSARRRLNTFPERDSPPHNCFWSAFHFADEGTTTDERRFDEPEQVQEELGAHYHPIDAAELRLGDVLIYRLPDGRPVHAAVYIADDIVFTKNGVVFHAPWVLMSRAQLAEIYDLPPMTAYRENDR
jgi:hypothetical protein